MHKIRLNNHDKPAIEFYNPIMGEIKQKVVNPRSKTCSLAHHIYSTERCYKFFTFYLV